MKYKLLLDDYRDPINCARYMHTRIGSKNIQYLEGNWIVCKYYEQFVYQIEKFGLPDIVSFDHDLADIHYSQEYNDLPELYDTCLEKTGYHCAEWLVNYCKEHDLKIPKYFIHTMNPIGFEKIKSLLENASSK